MVAKGVKEANQPRRLRVDSYFKQKDFWQSLVLIVIGGLLFVYSLVNHYLITVEWFMSPYLFPALIAVSLIVLAAVLLWESYQRWRFYQTVEAVKVSEGHKRHFKAWAAFGLVLGYYWIMPVLGFVIGTVFFLVLMFLLMGEHRWWMIGILALGTTFLADEVFGKLLHVMLP